MTNWREKGELASLFLRARPGILPGGARMRIAR
jgi:hypothetical protein